VSCVSKQQAQWMLQASRFVDAGCMHSRCCCRHPQAYYDRAAATANPWCSAQIITRPTIDLRSPLLLCDTVCTTVVTLCGLVEGLAPAQADV
jgi:hypothetical protein